MIITALHGFLGRGADWDFLRDAGFDLIAPDLSPARELPVKGDVLLGYSMGGRLALHQLIGGASFTRVVIVSAAISPPLTGRREADEAWARRFAVEPWVDLMRDWNAQPVFGSRPQKNVRDEESFDRGELASMLRSWSPAVLPPAGSELASIPIPVLWIAGEDDAKYVAEGRKAVSLLPRGELWICPGAGHRVPWEQQERFVTQLRKFVAV